MVQKRGYKVTRACKGVGLQPKTLADRLLKSIDLKISQNLEARQDYIRLDYTGETFSQTVRLISLWL
eukprot:931714-Pelagomonas_calceolata.AAC.1